MPSVWRRAVECESFIWLFVWTVERSNVKSPWAKKKRTNGVAWLCSTSVNKDERIGIRGERKVRHKQMEAVDAPTYLCGSIVKERRFRQDFRHRRSAWAFPAYNILSTVFFRILRKHRNSDRIRKTSLIRKRFLIGRYSDPRHSSQRPVWSLHNKKIITLKAA